MTDFTSLKNEIRVWIDDYLYPDDDCRAISKLDARQLLQALDYAENQCVRLKKQDAIKRMKLGDDRS